VGSALPLVVVIAVLWRLGRENAGPSASRPIRGTAEEVPLETDTF
jgi:hypothetical protein